MKKGPFSKRTTLCNEGVMLIGDSGYDPGGTPIWNRRGCLSEILNLTPKGDHLGVA